MSVHEFPPPANRNVVPEAQITPVRANEPLADSLATLLARVRAGELTAMAWVTLDGFGAHETGYLTMDDSQGAALLGATELLHSEYKGALE